MTLCSPYSYVTPEGPRFLVIHGDADNVMPHCQSERFAKALKENGCLERFISVPSGGHGPVTFNDSTFGAMVQFFQQEAKGKAD